MFLASFGHAVTAVDFSREGLRKAARLAHQRDVALEVVEADLASYDLGAARWSGIVSIFAHTPVDVRRRVHAMIPHALRVGGVLVLEAYRPEQLALATGGPRDASLMPTLADLRTELAGLDSKIARGEPRDPRGPLPRGAQRDSAGRRNPPRVICAPFPRRTAHAQEPRGWPPVSATA